MSLAKGINMSMEKVTRELTVAQKAWMAGVIEIRGKIRFTNGESRKTNELVLQVRSQHNGIIRRLCEMTGTNVGTQAARQIVMINRRPCTQHCDEAHSHVSGEIGENHVWSISGAGAGIVLHNLFPYFVDDNLSLRVVAANILAGLPHEGRGRSAVDQTIIRLRELGWDIPQAALDHFVGTPVRHKVA